MIQTTPITGPHVVPRATRARGAVPGAGSAPGRAIGGVTLLCWGPGLEFGFWV